MFKKLLILTMSVLVLGACGENDESAEELQKQTEKGNPHDVNTAVIPNTPQPAPAPVVVPVPPPVIQTAMQTLFFINAEDDLTFVQGQSRKVYFNVRTAFADEAGLKWNLKMVEGPKGAQFGEDTKGPYLQWNPQANTLTRAEYSKKYELVLKFGLLHESSASTKSELAGQDTIRKWEVKLLKDDSQPMIEDVVTYNNQDQTLNPGETGTIDFVVAANGVSKTSDLVINSYPGPDQPALELVQLDGSLALVERPQFQKKLASKDGKSRYQYRLKFDADLMIEHAFKAINANSTLKARYASERIKQVEAVFSVQALNIYNKQASQETELRFIVNLGAQASNAVLTGPESISLKQGSQSNLRFQILSAGGKGSVSVSHEVPETDGVTIDFNCNPASQMANRESCVSSNCRLECSMSATASCDAKAGVVDVPVKAITKLYKDEKETDFSIRVRVQANHEMCTGGQS